MYQTSDQIKRPLLQIFISNYYKPKPFLSKKEREHSAFILVVVMYIMVFPLSQRVLSVQTWPPTNHIHHLTLPPTATHYHPPTPTTAHHHPLPPTTPHHQPPITSSETKERQKRRQQSISEGKKILTRFVYQSFHAKN